MRCFLKALSIAMALLCLSTNVRGQSAEPFNVMLGPASDHNVFVGRWIEVLAKIADDSATMLQCVPQENACTPAVTQLVDLVSRVKAQKGLARLMVVNLLVNERIQYMSDQLQWNEADRWSSPLETLTTLKGDCEDYAILKYAVLLLAGVPPQDMRFVIVMVRDVPPGSQAHVVLAVRAAKQWFVLDDAETKKDLVHHGSLPQYQVQYLFDANQTRRVIQPFFRITRR